MAPIVPSLLIIWFYKQKILSNIYCSIFSNVRI